MACVAYCVTPTVAPTEALETPKTASSVDSTKDGIIATGESAKAREAFLYKLDSLVVGNPLTKVKISENEVAALEAEARRALDESYCYFCSSVIKRGDVSTMDDQVLVALAPKIVSSWSSQMSYPRLEFSEQDRQVQRPQFVSAFPAALALADLEKPTSLRFRVTALPANQTIFTVGVAKWPGFKLYFGKGFGQEENSWGLQWKAQGGSPSHPEECCLRLCKGDLISITCDTWAGSSTILLNEKEAGKFSLPCHGGETLVIGATLSTGCILRIES